MPLTGTSGNDRELVITDPASVLFSGITSPGVSGIAIPLTGEAQGSPAHTARQVQKNPTLAGEIIFG